MEEKHTRDFRGKIWINGERKEEWIYGAYLNHLAVIPYPTTPVAEHKRKHLIIRSGFSDWGMDCPLQALEVDPKTVSRMSSLRDVNGEPVYFDTDIVKITSLDLAGNVVEDVLILKEDNCGRSVAENHWSNPLIANWKGTTLEVIGNTIDNPELIEKYNL